MNILFISITRMQNLDGSGIYQNLMRKIRDEGHNVYVVTAFERRFGKKTRLYEVDGIHILGVRTLNNIQTNVIEKGISLITMERLYINAIIKLLPKISFDIILSSTPPIMLTGVVKYAKKNNPNAFSYLLLKDIFPQNAVDINMMSKRGVKGIIYHYFRRKEIELYKTFDYIGCMSPANVDYLLAHNPFVKAEKVEVAPNCADISRTVHETFSKDEIRSKYGLPLNVPIFVYGGSLGKPQGISYIIECLDANKDRTDCHFVIVGSGTEYKRIEKWKNEINPKSVSLFDFLPKEDYDRLVQSCDVGLIFLDHRFTIPNYPSRLLAYQENKIPVLAATDPNTDIGRIAEENGYGYWCESKDPNDFTNIVNKMLKSDIKGMGEKGYEYLTKNYLSKNTYDIIMKHAKN